MRSIPRLVLALSLTAAAHCGPPPTPPGTGSCTQTSSSGPFSVRVCTDYTGLTADQVDAIQSTCRNGSGDAGAADSGVPGLGVMGTFANASCDRSGSNGGCRVMSGGFSITQWYFGSVYTADLVRATCAAANGTFVSP